MAVIKTKSVYVTFLRHPVFYSSFIISRFSSSYHFSFFLLLIDFFQYCNILAMFSDETIRQSSNSCYSAFLGQVCRWDQILFKTDFNFPQLLKCHARRSNGDYTRFLKAARVQSTQPMPTMQLDRPMQA